MEPCRLEMEHFARFGNLAVVDPDEISMFRRLSNLIRQYNSEPSHSQPLGLAVFGAPGSGKTHTVTQLVKDVTNDYALIECNLAQIKDPRELYVKFLEARNYNIERPTVKTLPVVFLDEFDARHENVSFGWCKYLLPVLQGGTFRIDDHIYDTGKVLVVCAGGVCQSFRELEWRSRAKESRESKVPDLISRLRGYADIAGPNPYFPYPLENQYIRTNLENVCSILRLTTLGNVNVSNWVEWNGFPDETKARILEECSVIGDMAKLDPLYQVRRAVQLRDLLKKYVPFIDNQKNEIFEIGDRVLRALLNISKYKYGVRSMQAVLEMSVAIGRDSRRFTSAMVPPPEQIDMHVDAQEFYDLIYGEKPKSTE
jgi:hypothetical protein